MKYTGRIIALVLTFAIACVPGGVTADDDRHSQLVNDFSLAGMDLDMDLDSSGGPDLFDEAPTKTSGRRVKRLAKPEIQAKQLAAFKGLTAIPDASRNKWLLELLRADSDVTPHIMAGVADELGVSADESLLPRLKQLLDSQYESTQYAAARAIGHVGGAKAVAILSEAVGSDKHALRMGAIAGLGFCNHADAAPILESLAKTTSTAQREAVLLAMRELAWRTGQVMPRIAGNAGHLAVSVGSVRNEPLFNAKAYADFRVQIGGKTLVDVWEDVGVLYVGVMTPSLEADLRKPKYIALVQELLKRGGIVWITGDVASPAMRRMLKTVDVAAPQADTTAKMSSPLLYVMPTDPWRAISAPVDLTLAGRINARAMHYWQSWDRATQSAPIRNPDNLNQAALVVQTGVQGAGTVVFSLIQHLSLTKRMSNEWYLADNFRALLHPPSTEPPPSLRASTDYVSPHIPWARPLRDKLHVLFAVQAPCLREPIEVLQRLDCDLMTVPYWERSNPEHPKYLNAGAMDAQSMVWIQSHLGKDWDVLVTGSHWTELGLTSYGAAWIQWPTNLRQFVRKRVWRESKGLVLFHDSVHSASQEDWPDDLKPHVQPKAPALNSALPLLPNERIAERQPEFASIGAGRAAWLHHDMSILEDEIWITPGVIAPSRPIDPREYWYALFIRSIQFTSGTPDPVTIDRINGPGPSHDKFEVHVANKMNGAIKGTISLRLRDRFNVIADATSLPLDLKKTESRACAVTMKPIPAGSYILECVVRDAAGHVLGWHNRGVKVTSHLRITDVATDQDLYVPDSTITITGSLSNKPGGKGQINATLYDIRNRLIARGAVDMPPTAQSFAVKLPTGIPTSRLVRARVTLSIDGRQRAMEQIETIVDLPRHPGSSFPYYIWGTGEPAQFATLGFDGAFANSPRAFQDMLAVGLTPLVPSFDVGMHGMNGNVADRLDGQTLKGWSSPSFHMTQLGKARANGPMWRRAGVDVVMLADEDTHFSQWDHMGYAPSTLHEFRKWLAGQYGTLDALNAEWQAAFARWRDVMPMHYEQLGDRTSVAAWVDHRVFMDIQNARRAQYDTDVIRHYAPKARVGFSTAGDSRGWDLYRMAKAQTAMLFQGGQFQRKYLSWSRPDDYIATWSGGYLMAKGGELAHEKTARFFPWSNLFRGANSFSIWSAEAGSKLGYLRPDKSLTMPGRWIKEELKDIRSGIDTLLLNAKRDLGGVGIYYSKASQHVVRVDKPFSADVKWGWFDEWRMIDLAWQEIGWPVRWIAPQEAVAGRLGEGDIRLLILDACVAMSEAEADAIRRFVRNGGTAVGFVEVGTRNEHGGAPVKGLLADVFGFEYEVDQPRRTSALTRRVTFKWNDESYDLGEMPTPTRPIRLSSARSIDANQQAHAVTVNNFGKGRALFFNLSIRHLRSLGTWEAQPNKTEGRAREYDELITFFRELATSQDAAPGAVVTSPEGSYPWRIDVAPFHQGDAGYFGIVDGVALFRASGWAKIGPMPMTDQPVQIQFDRKGHLYEIRSHRYIGNTDVLQTTLKQATAKVFAIVPYEINGISIEEVSPVRAGQAIPIRIAVNGANGSVDHVCRVTVTDTSGKQRNEYTRSVICRAGKGEYVLPLAYNDPTGGWTIHAREVISGLTANVTMEVQP